MSLSRSEVQSRIHACKTLPSLPLVAAELLRLWEDESASTPRIGETVQADPALSVRLLRQANSPFYGFRSKVCSVERAVTLLGLNATMSLCLGFALLKDRRRGAAGGFDHDLYWHRSAATAVAARVLGRRWQLANPEGLFLAGLLQDLGMLALSQALPKEYDALLRQAAGDHAKLAELERESFEADHASFGGELLQKWGLPESIAEAVQSSHDRAPWSGGSPMARCVAAGAIVAEVFTRSAEATAEASDQLRGIFDDDDANSVLAETAAELQEVAENLDIDVGSPEEVEETLVRAKEALIELSLQAERQVRAIRSQVDRLLIEKEQLANEVARDGLTGLFSRAHLDERLAHFFDQCSSRGTTLSALFMDIDRFKKVNDDYGHQAGDAVLREVARVVESGVRPTDLPARYGGEEFVVILPGTPGEGARLIAERLREEIAGRATEHQGRSISVSVSIGVATQVGIKPHASAEDLLKAADSALFVAKREGPNRVVVD